jgi:23S rRNA pseudouridine1911/1915/1917 synthase
MSTTLLTRMGQLFPGASKTTLRDMIARKRVRLNGILVRSVNEPIADGDKIEVADTGDVPTETLTLHDGLRLIHFDGDIIIVDKPAGLLTSTDAQEKRPTAWRILQDHFRRQNQRNHVHLIHRLDRDASGLLIFARTWESLVALKKQFFEHTITRQYDVVVHGTPKKPKDRLEHLLVEDPAGVVHVTPDMKAGKLAILDYQVVETSKDHKLSRLRCTLYTGRKHQIRVQLKALGHAVCGDGVYGNAEEPPHRLALHAARLSLRHPHTGKTVSFESPMPGGMAHLLHV